MKTASALWGTKKSPRETTRASPLDHTGGRSPPGPFAIAHKWKFLAAPLIVYWNIHIQDKTAPFAGSYLKFK